MDAELESYLSKRHIAYKEHTHPAFFTVAEAAPYEKNLKFTRTKNLFLTDGKGNFFLYCLPSDTKAPLKSLKQKLELKQLSFASEKELKEQLNLTPGHVSIFALIRNPQVRLILDNRLWVAKTVGFHPNVNTATLELSHENFEKFYNSLPNPKEVLALA